MVRNWRYSSKRAFRSKIHLKLNLLWRTIMLNKNNFPILQQYPAQHPERLQLYSFATPNGVKVSMMLEEIGLPYEAHLVDIRQNQTWTDAFLSLNPNGKIPAIIDPNTENGEPLALFESGAILVYLAEKSGQLLATEPAQRYQTLQWVFFQAGAIGPMFGQLGFFHKFAGAEIEDKRPLQRYIDESSRLLKVLDKRLSNHQWVMGEDYSIADISMLGWVRCLLEFYQAGHLVDYDNLQHVPNWLQRGLARPASQRGLLIPE